MAQATVRITTPDNPHEIDVVLALSLATRAESSAREAVGWAQIIGTRLGGERIGLAGREVLSRCCTELGRSAEEVCTALALLDALGDAR
jgi:hypothetical protein